MIWLKIAANILFWPTIQIGIAAIFLRLPLELFTVPIPRNPARFGSVETRFYRSVLRIHRWKSALPDGAPWLGGFSKKRLVGRDPAYLAVFLAEVRRAELAHWAMFLCLPISFLWNPPWACAVMSAYAFAANFPCILAQRYNRHILHAVLAKKGQRFTPQSRLAVSPQLQNQK